MTDLQTFTMMLAKSETSFEKTKVEGGSWVVKVLNLLSTGTGVFKVITQFRFTMDGTFKDINVENIK